MNIIRKRIDLNVLADLRWGLCQLTDLVTLTCNATFSINETVETALKMPFATWKMQLGFGMHSWRNMCFRVCTQFIWSANYPIITLYYITCHLLDVLSKATYIHSVLWTVRSNLGWSVFPWDTTTCWLQWDWTSAPLIRSSTYHTTEPHPPDVANITDAFY